MQAKFVSPASEALPRWMFSSDVPFTLSRTVEHLFCAQAISLLSLVLQPKKGFDISINSNMELRDPIMPLTIYAVEKHKVKPPLLQQNKARYRQTQTRRDINNQTT